MFRAVSLSIIRSFSLYTQQWYNVIQVLLTILLASCRQYLYDIYYCCVYSEKLLMTDRETVRNM